ncbi:hypothetical protein TSUD_297500 [Trifolium subterraneum]|uniref:Uncharacterized protein n=1 Tax=Trifolium subterraneum TaxID=3900 RepID=A0A2Z6MIK2_TRISU|nr:hypothetical protein TSUD_297500 [Trifolium subterraneum]
MEIHTSHMSHKCWLDYFQARFNKIQMEKSTIGIFSIESCIEVNKKWTIKCEKAIRHQVDDVRRFARS